MGGTSCVDYKHYEAFRAKKHPYFYAERPLSLYLVRLVSKHAGKREGLRQAKAPFEMESSYLAGCLVSMAKALFGTLDTTSNSGSTSSVTSYFMTAPRNRATSLSVRP